MAGGSKHISWLKDTGDRYLTADGKEVEVWDFEHEADEEILSEWATHFRNHYCLDDYIDLLRGAKSREDYLTNIKFPSKTSKLGPGIRAGDFGEILVADYLEWLMNCWVPRFRWGSKMVRDESPKGSDVIGFKYELEDGTSNKDRLLVFETKTQFSQSTGKNRLQDAVNDSAKDHLRIDESLNFIKQKFCESNQLEQAQKIERFQTPVDVPYQETFGAAAIVTSEFFDDNMPQETDCTKIPKSKKSKEVFSHPHLDKLVLLVVKGPDMMQLVHDLYEKAAHEA